MFGKTARVRRSGNARVEWEQHGDVLQVCVEVRCLAQDQRQMQVHAVVDVVQQVIRVHFAITASGRAYRHYSLLRGFTLLPVAALSGMDAAGCDWVVVEDDAVL